MIAGKPLSRVMLFLLFLATTTIVAPGCLSGPGGRAGTAFGTMSGALIGAAAGLQNGKTLEGASIGAVAGGLLGGAAGHQIDEENNRWQSRQLAAQDEAMRNAISLTQVIELSQSGIGDAVIANQIRNQGVPHPLTTNDLVMLKQSGVSDSVIQAWQSAPIATDRVASRPAVRPVIIEERWSTPPATVWVRPPRHCPPPRRHGSRTSLHFQF